MKFLSLVTLVSCAFFATQSSAYEILSDEKLPAYRWGISTGITVPQPLSVGVTAVPSYDSDLSYFVEGGYFKVGFGKDRTVGDWSLMTGFRYHPFSNWFFFTLEAGYRHVGVSADISSFQSEGQPLASKAALGLNSIFMGVLVGGQWKLSQNVDIAFDLGLQMSLIGWGDVVIYPDPSVADDTDLSVDSSESMRRVAGIPLPQIALIRFIWYI